jgi:hypothetical protein
MINPLETYRSPDPIEALRASVQGRQEELGNLVTEFESGMDFLRDIDQVNSVLAESPRPELVLPNRVKVQELNSLEDLEDTNNFKPRLASFGIRTYEAEADRSWQSAGFRPPDADELDVIFQLGARGDYHGYISFTEKNGIDETFADDILLRTHISKESFMRMWIIFPELTKTIIARCLDTDRSGSDRNNEEVFVAYNLMSQLVDAGDDSVIRNGEVDTRVLCR